MNNKGQFKKGNVPWNKGQPRPLETKQKISSSKRRNYQEIPGLRRKISQRTMNAMKDVPYEKLAYWLGKKNPAHSVAIRGEKHPNWKGGISAEGYGDEWTEELRDKIRVRDNFLCKDCGMSESALNVWMMKHDVHHIDGNKENNRPENLMLWGRAGHLRPERRKLTCVGA